jgi:hypothetical protein
MVFLPLLYDNSTFIESIFENTPNLAPVYFFVVKEE